MQRDVKKLNSDSIKQADMNVNLVPGYVDAHFFHLLLSISMVRSDRIRRALEDVFVNGLSIEESCGKNAVPVNRFSREYNHLINVNCKLADLCRLIHEEGVQQI